MKSILSSPDSSRIPSVRELADRFSASTRTIHKVIRQLQKDDVIESRGRKGSFVKPLAKRVSRSKRIAILSTYEYAYERDSEKNSYPENVLNSLHKSFLEHGYEAEYFSVANLDVLTLRDSLAKMKLSGIVLMEVCNPLLITELRELYTPMISMDYNACFFGISSVYFSNSWGVFDATKHLLKMGHKNICLFNHRWQKNIAQSPIYDPIDEDRLHGYLIAMKDAKLPPIVIDSEGPTPTAVKNGLLRMLASNPKPTAFIFIKNYTVGYAMKELAELGYRIPEDISIISVDSSDTLVEGRKITYVWVDSEGMGKLGADALVSEIRRQASAPQRIELETKLVLGDSTRAV